MDEEDVGGRKRRKKILLDEIKRERERHLSYLRSLIFLSS